MLLVGAPASGKTHHYEHALQPQGYQLLVSQLRAKLCLSGASACFAGGDDELAARGRSARYVQGRADRFLRNLQEFGTERGFAVPLHVKGWLQQRLDVPVPTSGSEGAPLSPGPPPSGAPARLVLSTSFPSRHSRRNLLAYLRTTYPHARLRAIVFSPVGGFDEAASGKGGVELWKHNSVWRMAYQTRSGEEALNRNGSLGRAGPTSLVPIEAFKRWERDWEEPTLDEGELSLV